MGLEKTRSACRSSVAPIRSSSCHFDGHFVLSKHCVESDSLLGGCASDPLVDTPVQLGSNACGDTRIAFTRFAQLPGPGRGSYRPHKLMRIKKMTSSNTFRAGRLTPLEAYRGIAAIIVLVHHFFLGFSPQTTGLLSSDRTADSLIGTYYFVFFNGTGAVHFFFSLSGFVLCWSYFQREDTDKLSLAFLKRYPRLVGIVTVTTIASFLLFWLNLYHFQAASELSKSKWLSQFGFAIDPAHFQPNFLKAALEGLTTFFTGAASYNSNLWTMKHEFYGSLLVYMIALFVSRALNYRYLPYAFVLLLISASFYNLLMAPFVVGLFLSLYVAKKAPAISLLPALALIVLGLYMMGYMVPEKSYRWAALLPGLVQAHLALPMHTIGACLIILATMANGQIFRSLDGYIFRLLGRMSFPLYLVHLLVIGSISSYVYIRLNHAGLGAVTLLAITFAVTVLVSILASVPLLRLDEWWVQQINSRINPKNHGASAGAPSITDSAVPNRQ